jgi:hypothetical protein
MFYTMARSKVLDCITLIAEFRPDLVEQAFSAMPPINDESERKDLELWNAGSLHSGFSLLFRRTGYDGDLTSNIAKVLMKRMLDEQSPTDQETSMAEPGGSGMAPGDAEVTGRPEGAIEAI